MSRFKRSGELCKRAGRKPTKGKNKNKVQLLPKTCKYCNQSKTICPRMNCIQKYGLILRREEYTWLANCNVPQVSNISPQDCTDDAFQQTWQHILLRKIYKDNRGVRYVDVAGVDNTFQLHPSCKLFTFSALQNWLQSKPLAWHLLLEHSMSQEILLACGLPS